jgi:hypothetical protein
MLDSQEPIGIQEMELSRRARRGRLAVCALVLAIAALPVRADRQPSQREADSLSRKLMGVLEYSQSPARGARLTPVTEGELNSFLRLAVADRFPVGVTAPSVIMPGEGQVVAQAVVDLDAVRLSGRQGDWLDVRQWLTGRVPVEARGVLRAEQGWARFELERAEVSGIPLPKVLLRQIVLHYSSSEQFPEGVDLDAPFKLPARIREIHLNERQAVLVQR